MPNMKQLKYGLIIVILICCGVPMFTSCSTDSADAPPEQPQEQVIPSPRVTSKRYVAKSKMTVYNIEYPSTDPFGKPAMLSGTITIGDEVNTSTPAR